MKPNPRLAAEAFSRGQAAHQAGRLDVAEREYRAAIKANRGHAEAWNFLALVFAQTDRIPDAVTHFREAVFRLPRRAEVWTNLAEAERRAGNFREAVEAGQKAVNLAPEFPEAHFNLAGALRDAGRIDEAIAAYRRALALKPNHARAHYNLGNLLQREGKTPVAVEHFRQAATLNPKWWEPAFNLAVARMELGETGPALETLERLRPQIPPDAPVEIDSVLGDGCMKQGRAAEAKQHYAAVLAKHPERALSRLRLELLVGPIPSSAAEVEEIRTRAAETLARFAEEPFDWKPEDLHSSAAEPPMAWTYHGRDERPLKSAHAKLFLRTIPDQGPPPRRANDRPHVGFLVTNGHEGVFNHCLGGLAERLARRGNVRASWVSTRAGLNVLDYLRPTFTGGRIAIPARVDEAATALRASDVDVLYYWEVGTDSLNHFLPFHRPTPVQIAGWGWPSTAGHDRIDAYFSSEWLEPSDGDSHYVERLVRLPASPTYYERPPAPPGGSVKQKFGLAESQPLYFCSQNLRKLQPDFDAVLVELLRRDPDGRLLLLCDEQPTITERFRARLHAAGPDVASRWRLVARMPRPEYLQLAAGADVLLDPPGYGGGANTALDAAAVGSPVVTLPGAFHRGRWQTAVNERLGVSELNATGVEDYLQRCLALASDRERRETLRRTILASADALFSDEHAVSVLEAALIDAATRRTGSVESKVSTSAPTIDRGSD